MIHFFSNILISFVYLSSITLVVLVSMQTTKSEGLGGAIGGGLQSTTKYLPGSEETLQHYTSWVAGVWMVSCFIWFIISNHSHL